MKKNKFIFVLLLLISISAVCFGSTFFYLKVNNKNTDDAEFVVMTSCNPMYLAAINVVGDTEGVIVENLSQPTTGCLHDYTLTTEDMKNLSGADVLVVNGGGMEGYLDDVIAAYPELPIIDSSEVSTLGVSVDTAKYSELLEENSHTWMYEQQYISQVMAIAYGLAELDPEHGKIYSENYTEYAETIYNYIDKQGLDETLAGANVAILHEAFEYTAFSLNANVVATMDLDEERQVSAGEVSEFLDAVRDNNVQIVFAEYDYGNAMGKLITEQTDAKVVYLETLVHGDYTGLDYITVLNKNYALIKNSL